MVHGKGVGSQEPTSKPARRQYSKLISEIAELERQYPELADVRRVKLAAARKGHVKPAAGARVRRPRERYRTVPSGRAWFSAKAGARSATSQPARKQEAKPGSHLPVRPPRLAASDPVGELSATLAAELRRNGSLDLTRTSVPKLVQSFLRLVPRKTGSNALADQLGPFYDTAGLRTWLGISRQALEKRLDAGKLLGCTTSDRVRLYPAWQFADSGALLPGLADVLRALRHGTRDGWVIASWLTTPVDELDGTAAEWLADHRDPAPVIELARNDAAAWLA